jgi:DNA-binding response OmpR family regulator
MGETWMEIVVIHTESNLKTSLDFLKSKIAATYQYLPIHKIETQLHSINMDFLIFFHSANVLENLKLELIKKVKAIKDIPVLTIIPKNENLLEKAFHHGSDEVLYAPFSQQEFIIRTQALLKRRFQKLQKPVKQIMIQDLILDTDRYQITRGTEILPVTKLEFNILLTLATNPDKVFMKKELYEMIWQDQYYDNGNVLNVHIRRLRKKIEHNPDVPNIIETKWGIGYKINLSKKVV